MIGTTATMKTSDTYEGTLRAAQKVNWKIEDVIGGERRLDFTRAFLPEGLARVGELTFLGPGGQRTLNHIRAFGYLATFGLVEEFILPFVLDQVRPSPGGDDRTRALLQFAGEEAKHIELFRRFRQEFTAGFVHPCGTIGPPEAVAAEVLSKSPLGVALTILHIEWMTQRHFLDSVKDDEGLDPQFKSLLKHHWMEEAQHAKLDALMVEALAAGLPGAELRAGIEDYLAIGTFLDGGFRQQVELDLESLEVALGRRLADGQREAVRKVQLAAIRWTFLGSGMTHPSFLATVARLDPGASRRIEELGRSLS